jgi:NAD(P)-dependent dehydrogenase (short-subunit alcohol dehydrogenase family)
MSASVAENRGLSGTTALVTGGARGIGRAIALALAREGAAVAIAARSADELDRTLDELRAVHDRAIAVRADITDRAAVDRMVAQTQALLGPIDFLVNNAGSAGVIGPVWETDPDDWWREVEVNLRGPLLCARAVLPGMIARRRGRIVNMASGVGLMPFPYTSAYACSKVALIRLTDSLQEATAPHGVMVFATSPGRVRTSLVDRMEKSEAARRWIPRVIPTHPDYANMPWAPPESIADLCVRLARGEGDALAGRFIHVLYDFDEMRARTEEIARDDLYQLRLRTLPPR